jgi:hypothetical protein
VIRQQLASPAAKERRRKRPMSLAEAEEEIDLEELCDRAGVDAALVRELEDYSLLSPRLAGGAKRYPESDADVALACGGLARYGIAPRHLRAFRTSADREAGLLEQLVAPALRARSPERRRSALEDLEALADLARELSQLLFWRALRKLAP